MDIKDLAVVISTMISFFIACWTFYEFRMFRKNKYKIEFDIEAKYNEITNGSFETYYLDKKKKPIKRNKNVSYMVEITLKFTNKGNVRVRLYNIQAAIKTIKNMDKLCFDLGDNHLKLNTIHETNNLVPIFKIPRWYNKSKTRPIEKTSFYYIEPGVEQKIRHLTMIERPNEIIQVEGKFNFEQKRMDLNDAKNINKGLYPHTATKIYRITSQSSETQQPVTS